MNVRDALEISYQPGECAMGGTALARFVGDAYRKLGLDGLVAIGGSVGRGDADRYSDLEILSYWPKVPSADQRRHVVRSLGGDLWTMDREGETMEHFGIGELQAGGCVVDGTSMVSVSHISFTQVETAIERVFVRFGTDLEDQAMLSALQDSVPLDGFSVLDGWKARIASYPDELAQRVIRENITFGPWFVPQSFASRGDRFALHRHMHVIEGCLLRILAALNGTLIAFPDGKWARRMDMRLNVAPSELRTRLDACYQPDLMVGWESMKCLMMETIDLVEARYGAILTTDGGENLCEWARKRWDPLPPYTLMLAASIQR